MRPERQNWQEMAEANITFCGCHGTIALIYQNKYASNSWELQQDVIAVAEEDKIGQILCNRFANVCGAIFMVHQQ